ncbi:family 10 glycosylhydrolase [Crocinitomicaceae bacterium]|nr:family 10 glycosylhydrolase [Crocinitomicaceae bacterium]
MRSRLFFLLILTSASLFGQSNLVDVSNQIIQPKTYVIARASGPIKVDGKADNAWGLVPFSDKFVDIEGEKPVKFDTRFKMLWDDTYLYVYAEMDEPHVWGDITDRDAIIYLNNDFEVFINSSEKTEAYAEIEINALNTVWDLLLDKPYRASGYANFHWDLNELKTAVSIDGTLNKSKDIDKGWSVEMAIPLKPLIELKNDKRKPIQEGDQWRMNFSRVEWDYDLLDGEYERKKVDGKLQREYNWVWSEQGAINMHMPENWGIVQFTESTNPDQKIIEDSDFLLKQSLYALYVKERYNQLHIFDVLDAGQKRLLSVKYGPEAIAEITAFKTNTGYEFVVDGKNGRYVIDNFGKLIQKDLPEDSFTIATWAHGSQEMDHAVWDEKLERYKSLGISEVLVGGSPAFLQELVAKADSLDMRIHAWMWTLNRPNDSTAMDHPEWYAVNRAGQNSLEYRAYVDYYQWLSPFHPEAREYIKSNVRKLMKVEGLASIHLDYVRYVDVILGADLQPKYDLVQDEEMPEYDYGYHPIARKQFKELFGVDPMEMEHPALSTEWRQFRLNAVTSLVNEIAEEVHARDQRLSAAVFPFPEMSRQMVRQAWDDWNLDYVFPMIYHNFYRESIPWIGFATEQGLRDVDYPLYTGLYMPGFESVDDFQEALRLAKEKGASGVCLFTVDGMKEELKQTLKYLISD